MHPKIPYFQTTRYRVQAMLDLATSPIFHPRGGIEAAPQERVADLGSGDGRIVIAFAQKGIETHGYEIDEQLIAVANEQIKNLNLQNRAFIFNKNFWDVDLSAYGIIAVYGMPDVMNDLEKKLRNELKPGSRVVSNYYQFPTWKEVTKKDNVYLYIKE